MNPIRRVATLAALALTATALVAAPAHAEDAPALTWSFSDYLANPSHASVGFTSHAASGGATSSGADVVFGGGTGTVDGATGDLDVSYQGSVTYTWHVDVTFSNPEVIVEGGKGRILADVSWAVPDKGSADDVVLTTFDAAGSQAGGTLTATPDWASGSWAPQLLTVLPDSIDAFFKTTGSSSDARKAPASFSAGLPSAAAATPSVATAVSYAGTQVNIDVDGSGFTAVTNPGDAGVYVALAPAGKFPETDDFEDQDKVADTEWVTPAQMADGTFSVTLDPTNDVLDPSQRYAVYTWQAHGHSNPTQDTTTPVEIAWSKLAGPTTLGVSVAKKPTAKKAGSLTAKVTGAATAAAGKLTTVLTKKGEKSKTVTSKVAAGSATVKLPKLVKGTWKAKVTFVSSTAAYKSATKSVNVKVTKK